LPSDAWRRALSRYSRSSDAKLDDGHDDPDHLRLAVAMDVLDGEAMCRRQG
jgi:hypothetical protein